MTAGNTQLEALREELRKASETAAGLWSRHPAEQLVRRPAPGKWSAAECVEHLNLSNRAYLPRIQEALGQAAKAGPPGSGPLRMEWNARLLRWWLEPPSRLKLPTAAPFVPLPVTDPSQVLLDFVEINAKLAAEIASAEGQALDRVKIRSPFAENMKYGVFSAFVLVAAHNRRHLWQAARAAG